jgi:lipopolysaccharide transport system permease protein
LSAGDTPIVGAAARAAATLADRRSGAVVTICPPSRWPGLALAETWRLRRVLFVLAQRVLRVRYRNTVIGAGWALIQPIMLMIALSIFFGLLARIPSEGVPYPVFIYTGLIVWQVTMKLLAEGGNSLLANASLVTRIYFPRAYFPGAVALSTMVDLIFTGTALALLMAWFGIIPGPAIVAVPVVLAITYTASLGLALWFSALNVYYRDVAVLLPFIIQVGFFLSPIIYSASLVPEEFRVFYFLNPMAVAITGMRGSLLGTPMPPFEGWIAGSAVAVLLLVSGYVFFRRREGTFADVI